MNDWWPDSLRFGARSLVRERGFSITVIATLALAIALESTAIATVNAYLVRSLPYPGSSRLYSVTYSQPGQPVPPRLNALDWQALSDVIEQPVAWDLDVFYLIGGDHPEAASGAWVTQGFMQGLGIRPALGRAFSPEEFEPGAPQVALISYALWQVRFGGDTAVLGRQFEAYVSDRPDDPEIFTIAGVLPSGFWHINTYTNVLTPLRAPTYPYLVKLREGVSTALAEQRITDLVRAGGTSPSGAWRVQLRSVHSAYAARVRPLLLAIGAAVSLVLLIACANVAVLVVIRGMRRQKEMALRLALGAGPGRLARLLMSESLLLAGMALVTGGMLARVMIARLAPSIERHLGRQVPGGAGALSLDVPVLGAIVGLTIVIAVGLTLAPLLLASRRPLFDLMRGRQSGVDSARGRRVRSALVATEVAGTLALLVGAGLMVRTVAGMLDVDMGVEPRGVIAGSLGLRERTYPSAVELSRFYERFLGALVDAHGTAAAVSYPPPLAEIDPRPVRAGGDGSAATTAGVFSVTPDWFAVLGISLVEGRLFTRLDRLESEPVALVSASAARRLWGGGRAIGRRLQIGDSAAARIVVGVVRDVLHSPTDESAADVYVPMLQEPGRFGTLLVRATGDAAAWAESLRRVLGGIDAEASLRSVRRLDDDHREQLARPRFLAAMLAGFGLFAVTLALIGVYGVVSFTVRQREHEIAVRMAVGADGAAIVAHFMRETAVILLAGVALGALGAAVVGRLLEAQLYGVAAMDARTLALSAAGLVCACLAAIWWPARRAGRTDPVVALRAE